MHLLAARPGTIADGMSAIDLLQTPGEIVLLSAADTELACLAEAHRLQGPGGPTLRLANLLFLGHNMSVDLYLEKTLAQARLVIVRLLGGERYWPYGVEQLSALARERGIAVAFLPGDDKPDPELARRSTLPAETRDRLWRYLVEGGVENAVQMLDYAAGLIGYARPWREPKPLLKAGLYWPGLTAPGLEDLRAQWQGARPVALIVFYRALLQAGQLEAINGLIEALDRAGLDALPVHVASLKDSLAAGLIEKLSAETKPDVILNATAFALSQPGAVRTATPFDGADCPVFQVVLSSGGEAEWREGTNGLAARDIAMHVALPEVDGRILTRAVAFKAEARRDEATQCGIVAQRPLKDRLDFVADLAAGWARLRRAAPASRRVALILANYPNRDGRIGNGVGLDTPASAAGLIRSLAAAGYATGDDPQGGAGLMARLLQGPTNSGLRGDSQIRWSLADYRRFIESLPRAVQEAVTARWGAPERDPFFADGVFHLPGFIEGNLVVAVQPARGYNIDPVASYHDPALVPPHGYLAFYGWLRRGFEVHAVVHVGKHGNLEWLPGKALALSQECWPEATLGPLPQLYPFIVNDPGEGSQAKRRSAAVILDHLTPPLARAESYGQLEELERLVDEYYEASGLDPRRCKLLRDQILDLTRRLGLDKDCNIAADEAADSALVKLDSHLCEIKELQIRDGLHVFGRSPTGALRDALLVALARVPRGKGEGADQSILRALAKDLELGEGFDPLDADWAQAWTGARPAILQGPGSWRHQGDTVERLELLALKLVAGEIEPAPEWARTQAVLGFMRETLAPQVEACGHAETQALLAGLDGRFVAPGPSGAPTRGRLEVLPTGRNFYSVDTRCVPTPAAWQLGWKSASMLIERYRQEHGAWPTSLALSAWGTANMRTGGDDIAQALALMGVRPRWDTGSARIAGFEVLPITLLGRPRVDVTFRISGFFRDAFPAQVDLIDSAARAVAALDETPAENPLAARVAAERSRLLAEGATPEAADRRAGFRIFGSMPGAYGAGLQALIDERGWRDSGDLARAYVAWGGYAYGSGSEGEAAHGLFEARLSQIEGVLHNQDNREHDLLDSDDYYQFEGGLAAAVKEFSGRKPVVYHNDHSRPETPKVRRLEEEIARVVRGRAANPKWIAGVMRHGYKGAFEMAATVDYLFAFAATTGAVGDHHFEALYEAYLVDDQVAGFIRDANPAAGREMAERFNEAIERGLWKPRANSVHARLDAIREGRA